MGSLTPEQSGQIAKLFAQHFIARPDVKAIQNSDGEYRPLRGQPFTMADLKDHVEGRKTYGHYMINELDQCKLFCFDIDLLPQDKHVAGKVYQKRRLPSIKNNKGQFFDWHDGNPRKHWASRTQGAAREFLKFQMLVVGTLLASRIQDKLEIPTLVSYSGSKGIHVYGFTGKTSASLARQAAQIVLESFKETASETGYWELTRGNNFYSYRFPGLAHDKKTPANEHPEINYEQFSLEVYPKQESLHSKDLGNLLRLPLGVNLKSPKRDPGFFIGLGGDVTNPDSFKPMDPITALTTLNPWQ